jgi:hypothetical protein
MYQREAPFAFAIQSLRVVRGLPDDISGWIYDDLIRARPSIATLAAATVLVRYRAMSPSLRIRVSTNLRRRCRRLLFWFPPGLEADLQAIDGRPGDLAAIIDLARTARGKRRDRLIAHFAALLRGPRNAQDWLFSSQYHPIRYLFEQADMRTREQISKAVADCSDNKRRLHFEVCLFPALAEAARVEIAPRLLREIAPPPPHPVTAGSTAEQQFSQLQVLFLHGAGDMRTKALLAILRIGAHMPRRRWLYDLRHMPSMWPAEMRTKLSAALLEATRDAIRLWP